MSSWEIPRAVSHSFARLKSIQPFHSTSPKDLVSDSCVVILGSGAISYLALEVVRVVKWKSETKAVSEGSLFKKIEKAIANQDWNLKIVPTTMTALPCLFSRGARESLMGRLHSLLKEELQLDSAPESLQQDLKEKAKLAYYLQIYNRQKQMATEKITIRLTLADKSIEKSVSLEEALFIATLKRELIEENSLRELISRVKEVEEHYSGQLTRLASAKDHNASHKEYFYIKRDHINPLIKKLRSIPCVDNYEVALSLLDRTDMKYDQLSVVLKDYMVISIKHLESIIVGYGLSELVDTEVSASAETVRCYHSMVASVNKALQGLPEAQISFPYATIQDIHKAAEKRKKEGASAKDMSQGEKLTSYIRFDYRGYAQAAAYSKEKKASDREEFREHLESLQEQ